MSLIAFAVLANLASVAAKIAVWRRTLAVTPDGARIRHRDLTPAVFIGFLVNTIVPARLGEVAKLAILGRRTRERGVAVPAGALAGSLAAEQIVLAAALVLVAAAGTVASSSAPVWVLATLASMSASRRRPRRLGRPPRAARDPASRPRRPDRRGCAHPRAGRVLGP